MLDVRSATPDDAEVIATLNDEFNATATTADDVRTRFEASNGHELVYIATEDEVAVGFACAQVYDSICYRRPMAEVTEIYVRDHYRNRGVGSALLARIESDLVARQVSEVRIETGLANEIAKTLYLSSGYSAVEHQVLVKKLE